MHHVKSFLNKAGHQNVDLPKIKYFIDHICKGYDVYMTF